jgi:hypothetical protein
LERGQALGAPGVERDAALVGVVVGEDEAGFGAGRAIVKRRSPP